MSGIVLKGKLLDLVDVVKVDVSRGWSVVTSGRQLF